MTTKNKINLSIVISLISAILIFVFVIHPTFQEIETNSRELVSQKEGLSYLEARITVLEKFKIFSRESKEILEKTDSLFTDSEVPVEFISFLERSSRESQLEIGILPISVGKTRKDPWPSLVFQVTATGLFSDFLSFLERMENSPYLIGIQKLDVNKLAREEVLPTGEVKAVFNIKVFTK